MPRKKEVDEAVKDLIIGFGVLEGIFVHAGVNPESEIFKAFSSLLKGTDFEWYIIFAGLIFFVAIPIVQVLKIYEWGEMIGIFSLIIAFIGGVFINTLPGILLAAGGILLGYYSFSSSSKYSFSEFIDDISTFINYFKR